MRFARILTLLLFFLIVILAVQNAQVVRLRFLYFTFTASRAIVICSAFVAGVVFGWLTAKKSKK